MLELYFINPRTCRWLRLGPFGPHIDALAWRFQERGYSRHSARGLLRGAAHWSRHAMWLGVESANEMSATLAERFLKEHLPTCSCERPNSGMYKNAAAAVTHVLEYLEDVGCISRVEIGSQNDILATLMLRYDEYLDRIVGLVAKSRAIHQHRIMHFLNWRRSSHPDLDLSDLTAQDILSYLAVCDEEGRSLDWRKAVTGCLRGFLRFLRWERILEVDLTPIVFPVIRWRLSTVPRYMSFDKVKCVLAMPDTSRTEGKRDMAILALLGLLGLRASEVVGLRLDDIDWRQGQIRIAGTKSGRQRSLPIMPEVASVLADYIKNGRPTGDFRELFLRTNAPMGPITSPGSLIRVVCKYLDLAGVSSPSRGTHLFRHSLATHMINNGVSAKEIADLLGHLSIETTGIYAKVNVNRLKDVALPFPGREVRENR